MFSDLTFEKFTKKDYQRLFLYGAVLGGLFFILIYGISIINPSYTDWIYYGDNDLKQHFMGWCHYRNSAWHFPVGLIDSLSFPYRMSTIYTDSIPGVALLFKAISFMLPEEFQYFGIVGLLSFVLCGGTSVVLLKRFVKSPWVCLMLCPFFVVSFPIIQRMYYHTALAAHWILFLSFILWAYDPFLEKSYKPLLYWGIMGVLCVSIHSYYLPMVGMILMGDRIVYFIKTKKNGIDFRTCFRRSIQPVITFCWGGILALWIYGGLYGSSSGVGYGLGTFNANLNTFFNPIDYGYLLPQLGLENYFQYEGCGYLGVGMLLMVIVSCAALFKNRKRIKEVLDIDSSKAIHIYTALGVFAVAFMLAVLPTISFGSTNLGTVRYPERIYNLLSIFRSNGRFVWVSMYILMLIFTIVFVKLFDKNQKLMFILIVAFLILQGTDLSKMIREKHEFYSRNDYSYETMWDSNEELNDIAQNKKHFVFLYNENDLTMETAFYAYKHNMTLNNFYFARDIDEQITYGIDTYVRDLSMGLVRPDTVYVIKMSDYEANENYFANIGLKIAMIDDHVIFAAR